MVTILSAISKSNLITFIFIFTFYLNIFGEVKITEIHYHPLNDDLIESSEFEFIELKNIGTQPIDLTNKSFTKGIKYNFKSGTTIEANKFIIIASNSSEFEKRYGFAPFDEYKGKLNNSGEKIVLKDTVTSIIISSIEYNDKSPWPITPDGSGFSLVPKEQNPTGDPNNAHYWRASYKIHGSPGIDDIDPQILGVVINEALTHTDSPNVDAIELYNPNNVSVDISGWYLTDNKQKPKKFKIPASTVVAALGYKVFDENDFNPNSGNDSGFSLNSHGEEVYIFSANSNDSLTGYSHGFKFGEIENWISFGRHITSTGKEHFVAQKEITLGKTNSGPRVGPIVISEIMYNPIDSNEYLEITNISDAAIRLYDPENPKNTWKVSGIAFNFPENTSIPIGGTILIISNNISIDDFKKLHSVSENIQIFTTTGSLSNSGEAITILKPEEPYIDSSGVSTDLIIPYMRIDRVKYNDNDPWPLLADGKGHALERRALSCYGDDPVNWTSKNGSPGIVNVKVDFWKNKKVKKTQLFLSNNSLNYSKVSIQFNLEKNGFINLNLFNLQGKLIKEIYSGKMKSGFYSIELERKTISSGIYFCRFKTSYGSIISKKIIFY